MVLVGDDSSYLQMRWPIRSVVIYGNFIVLVVLSSVCIYCCKRKQESCCEGDDSEGDDSNLLPHDDHVRFDLPPSPQPYRKSIDSRSPSIFSPFKKNEIQPKEEKTERTPSLLLPPTDHINLSLQPSPQAHRKRYDSRLPSIFIPFRNTEIQPNEGEKERSNSIVLPPTDNINLNPQPSPPAYRKRFDARSPSIFNPFRKVEIQPNDEQKEKSSGLLLPPTDGVNLNVPPLSQPYRKSIDSRSHSIFSPFKKIEIQPEKEDILPFVLPQEIPEAPAGLSEELGTIYFSISYDVFGMELKVLIQKAVNLPAKDMFGTSDPYVKVNLLPGGRAQKLSTRIRMKNLNPTWNEAFSFEGFPHEKLIQKSLYLQVFDYDRFFRDDELGETEIALGNISLQKEPVFFIKKLRACKHSRGYLGDLLVSMCYNATSMRITIIVMKGSRLKSMDVRGSSDCYVNIYHLHSGRKVDKKKTQIHKKTLNPVWNEVFEFEIPVDKIRTTSFVFTVKDHNVIIPNEIIGKVVIGHRSCGTSLKHWTNMLNNSRKAIAMWHTIVN